MNEDLPRLVNADWLLAFPCGIILRNADGHFWANPALLELLKEKPESFRLDQWDELLEAAGMVNLMLADGGECWLQGEWFPVPGPDHQTLSMGLFRDVADEVHSVKEREHLHRKVKELTLTDPVTGLANRRALGQALAMQVSRSRRYQNPLTLVLVRMTTDDSEAELPECVLVGIARLLRERLRWVDLIGREQDDCFMLIMPETDEAAARALLERIRVEATDMRFPPPRENLGVRLTIGVSQWRKGQDGAHLVAAVHRALEADHPATKLDG
jgi:diguanylate cyclase (GGDEF)-like protein